MKELVTTSIYTKLYEYNPEFNSDWKVLTELDSVLLMELPEWQ